MDGGSTLMSVAMKVWSIESAMRLGLPETPPYGILEGVMETAASFEARLAPWPYSTNPRKWVTSGFPITH